VGHEINNPLSAVILSIDVARRRILPAIAAARAIAAAAQAGAPAPPDALATIAKHAAADQDGRIFDDMATAADAIASIVRDLRTFARADQDESPEHVAVDDLIERAIRLSGREATRRGVLERDYAADLPPLVLPRGRVTQVIMNVFINAFHAIAEVDRPKHRVKITARADEDFVAITVSDTGPGIPPEALERIFDPFFTTKRQGLGTGLGLSISRAILRRLGGELSVESVYGEGAAFVCFLPIPTPDLLARGARAAVVSNTSDESSTARSILVVDDDERILRSYARLLGARHRVMVAYDGREAIDLIRSGSSPDVLVIELDLPSDENHELLAWLQAERPDLVRRAILVTSGSGAGKSEGAFGGHPGPILLKPMHGEALLAAIDAAASQDAPRSWR
jgi:CheY-like chemotaxis protein